MKNIGDAQAIFRRHFFHALEHQRQLRTRNSAVHTIVVGGDGTDRRERALAASPEQQPFLFRTRGLAGDCMAIVRDRLDALDQMIDLSGRPVELHDQERLDIERVTGVHELLDRRNSGPVHNFHAARNYSRANDA